MRPVGFQQQTASPPQAYLPFMLAVKGPIRTIELSLLRYDGTNLFLSKPESAPALEQKWRVAPLRWSAEREPFCVLTHRETSRMRLVVAKPDCACELWPVMYSSDTPDGGIANCSVSPSRCKLVSFMWKGGLYVIARDPASGAGAVLQVSSPQEAWQVVRDPVDEWSGIKDVRVTPFYSGAETFVLVQDSTGTRVCQITDPAEPWTFVCEAKAPLRTSKVLFVYSRNKDSEAAWPVSVFAVWVDGCSLLLARVADPREPWELLCTVPVPPHTKLGAMYAPFLPEPLLVSTSTDPHYLGSVALRRLFLAERVLNLPAPAPRVIRYMQVPALPVAPRDLTADFPISDLPYREFYGEFVGKRLPYDLTPANVPMGIPAPPRAGPHGPVPVLTTRGVAASLQDRDQLDWVPTGSASDPEWAITPLRWAPGHEVLFVLLQSVERKTTRVAIASSEKACGNWSVQCEFPDSAIPFSECKLIPFQYQTMPGASDMFVLAIHEVSQKGGLFFVSNPKSEWQFIRELNRDEEPELFAPNARISVMYHRSKDVLTVNLCTFFVISDDSSVTVRVLIEPNQPTFDVTAPGLRELQVDDLVILYTFAPKPPVTHVWPCEVFAMYRQNSQLVCAHIAGPDLEWRELYRQSVPRGMRRLCPVYLPYLGEPLLLAVVDGNVDLLRPNLIEAYSENKANAKFIHRYKNLDDNVELLDITLDTALVWIPQMGLQGMHPYSGYPLPFESRNSEDKE